jgi:hypothetical protein
METRDKIILIVLILLFLFSACGRKAADEFIGKKKDDEAYTNSRGDKEPKFLWLWQNTVVIAVAVAGVIGYIYGRAKAAKVLQAFQPVDKRNKVSLGFATTRGY